MPSARTIKARNGKYYKSNAESIRSRKRDNYQNNPQNKKDASRASYNADPNKAAQPWDCAAPIRGQLLVLNGVWRLFEEIRYVHVSNHCTYHSSLITL